jgi:predicted amidohydrolase
VRILKYKIALVSLNQIWEDKILNWALCKEYIKNAANVGVDLIVFPEMTLTGFSFNTQSISEDQKDSKTIEIFSQIAKKYNIAIVFGMVVGNKSKISNKSIFISSDGGIVGEYIKIHPFTLVGEDKYFNSGDKLGVFQYKSINIGLSICYDLRFPEMYSAMAKKCDMIINIANWPKKRISHWRALLKARAIENQIFIIGVNRTGIDGNNLEYVESSCIYNADGGLMPSSSMGDMHIYEVDKQWQEGSKCIFSTAHDRKIEFYKEIL